MHFLWLRFWWLSFVRKKYVQMIWVLNLIHVSLKAQQHGMALTQHLLHARVKMVCQAFNLTCIKIISTWKQCWYNIHCLLGCCFVANRCMQVCQWHNWRNYTYLDGTLNHYLTFKVLIFNVILLNIKLCHLNAHDFFYTHLLPQIPIQLLYTQSPLLRVLLVDIQHPHDYWVPGDWSRGEVQCPNKSKFSLFSKPISHICQVVWI